MSAGAGPTRRERLRYLLVENETLILGACLLLVLGGGVVAVQAHTGPDTRPEQRVAGTWTTNGSVDHGAVVQEASLAFDEGAVLQNRSVYFRQVTPILNGTVTITHEGSPSDVSTTTDLRLVVRSVDGGPESGRVLWAVSEPIRTVESSGTRPTQIPFAVNVSEHIETAARTQEDLRTTQGQSQVLLVAETRAQATVAGERVSQTRRDQLRIRPRGGLYAVTAATAGAQTESVSETVAVPVETDPVRAYGSLLAVLAGLVVGAGILWLDREGQLDVPAGTASAIESAKERESFDEWISRGRVPATEGGERVVDVDSLEDLVDVAIDSDRRVIEDGSGEFAVFDGRTRYRFRPDGGPTDGERVVASQSGSVSPDGHDGGGDASGVAPDDGESLDGA